LGTILNESPPLVSFLSAKLEWQLKNCTALKQLAYYYHIDSYVSLYSDKKSLKKDFLLFGTCKGNQINSYRYLVLSNHPGQLWHIEQVGNDQAGQTFLDFR
jgi:hypothetical protein